MSDPKVFVMTPWRFRNHFVPIYNHLWLNQNYSNFSVNIFIEKYMTEAEEWRNQFDSSFNQVRMDTGNISIGKKLNIAIADIPDDYDYIVYADSDDYYGPNYISKAINYMKENNLEAMNMMDANYLKIPSNSDEIFYLANPDISESYRCTFIVSTEVSKRFYWNDRVRAGEDRDMIHKWRKNGVRYQASNACKEEWLGILHGSNWNTNGRSWQFKGCDMNWLFEYVNDDAYVVNFYETLFQYKV